MRRIPRRGEECRICTLKNSTRVHVIQSKFSMASLSHEKCRLDKPLIGLSICEGVLVLCSIRIVQLLNFHDAVSRKGTNMPIHQLRDLLCRKLRTLNCSDGSHNKLSVVEGFIQLTTSIWNPSVMKTTIFPIAFALTYPNDSTAAKSITSRAVNQAFDFCHNLSTAWSYHLEVGFSPLECQRL